jgi:hypothetical protein
LSGVLHQKLIVTHLGNFSATGHYLEPHRPSPHLLSKESEACVTFRNMSACQLSAMAFHRRPLLYRQPDCAPRYDDKRPTYYAFNFERKKSFGPILILDYTSILTISVRLFLLLIIRCFPVSTYRPIYILLCIFYTNFVCKSASISVLYMSSHNRICMSVWCKTFVFFLFFFLLAIVIIILFNLITCLKTKNKYEMSFFT